MTTYTVQKQVASRVKPSANVLAVARMFGIGADSRRHLQLIEPCEIKIEPGNVVYITGGSGSGKERRRRACVGIFYYSYWCNGDVNLATNY